MSYTVKVSSISPKTTKDSLSDFFTFCGKISSIDHDPSSTTAVIHFEKASAAKTALMLNGGTLDGSHLEVSSETVHPDTNDHHDETTTGENIDQTDKPKAGIAAEYLARGYQLSDQILQRAIDIDANQGISTRFINYMKSLDATLGQKVVGPDQTISAKVQETLSGAQAKAREVDQQRGLSKTAESYYARAIQHPLGNSVLNFYTSTAKQVKDIHEEARRIADHHKTTKASETPASSETSAPKTA